LERPATLTAKISPPERPSLFSGQLQTNQLTEEIPGFMRIEDHRIFHLLKYMKKPTISDSDKVLTRINSRKVDIEKTAINSAAIQDHLMRVNKYMFDPLIGAKKIPTFKKPNYAKKVEK
jgi:hypothetical protein